jgi:hypothetical protein
MGGGDGAAGAGAGAGGGGDAAHPKKETSNIQAGPRMTEA